MEIKTVDSIMLSQMFLAGAKTLEAKKELINELNVFPVPDGDTGTNMTMTIMSAAREVAALENPDMKTVSKAISSGSLRGARGNSGVILSQLFRGFSKVVKNYDELTVDVVTESFQKAVETAYKAVMKPKEGTILTVAKGVADRALEVCEETDDFVVFVQEILKAAEDTLAKTPDMLPVLKQAGVVDSGGQGLVEVLRGGYLAMIGEITDFSIGGETEKKAEPEEEYDYSFSMKIGRLDASFDTMRNDFNAYLERKGFGIKQNATPDMLSIECQTNEPGKIITKAIMMGYIDDLKVEYNNKPELETASASTPTAVSAVTDMPAEKKAMGFVAVSIGEGINNLFTELGADQIIAGGQTMNPCTDDFLAAIDKVNADTVFLLPNNKNVILAANQAVDLCKDKRIIVIPSKTIPQGITALINFIPDETPEENFARMEEEIKNVKTGEVTYSIRDTLIDDKEIHQGDYMGIGDKGILAVSKDMTEAVLDMLSQIVDEDSALISLYYGADVTAEDAEALAAKVRERFTSLDIELAEGGQPIYYYVLSVE